MTVDREYFESDNQSFGYRGVGYRDFAVHTFTADLIARMNPSSVLDLGGARGYIAKKLIAKGILSAVLDRSLHCFYTRAVPESAFILYDVENVPYPIGTGHFDLVFSDSVLEHVRYNKIDDVIQEIARVGKRSMHGIAIKDGNTTNEQFFSDGTHVIFETKEWWEQKFKELAPDHKVVISRDIFGEFSDNRRIPLPENEGNKIKLNFGCFINMFYYGWTNIDLNLPGLEDFARRENYAFILGDMRNVPFPFQEGTVDLIFASHALEHVPRLAGLAFLKECRRILKPGGLIRIAVPDAAKLLCDWYKGNLDYLKHFSPEAEGAECSVDKLFEVLLSGHATIYDECSLKMMFRKAGFSDVKVMDPFHSQDKNMENETIVSHPVISLVMEAKK